MNPNDQNENSMEKEIEKRRFDTEKEMYKELETIFRKSRSQLTQEDKGFLQARRDYLTRAQREEYEDELSEDLHVEKRAREEEEANGGKPKEPTLEDLTRKELDAKATELGIPEPEKLPNRQAVILAIKDNQPQ